MVNYRGAPETGGGFCTVFLCVFVNTLLEKKKVDVRRDAPEQIANE